MLRGSASSAQCSENNLSGNFESIEILLCSEASVECEMSVVSRLHELSVPAQQITQALAPS